MVKKSTPTEAADPKQPLTPAGSGGKRAKSSTETIRASGKSATDKKGKKKNNSPFMGAIDELLGLQKSRSHLYARKASDPTKSLSAEEQKAISYYEEGIQKTLDLIAPAGMEVRAKELILNDMHVRTLYAYNWPTYIYPNWLSSVINFDAQMDISQFIYPTSNKAIMKMLRKKVAEMRSSIRILEQRGIVRDPGLEAALQDAEELRDLLARGSEKLFQFAMYISIYADDEEKLKKTQTDVETLLGGKLILTKPAMFQMEHGWISTLPLCRDELEISRNMNTSPIATSFPFSSSDLTDDHGILYGINRHNDSLVIFDRFDLPNANATVFATSGAGKSFAVKLEVLRSMIFGTEIFIIDPENEYVDLSKTVGGTYIPISLQSDSSINPFDLPKPVRGDETRTGEELRSAVITLHGLFKLMLGTLTPSEDSILDKAILDTYALKNITLQTEKPELIEPPTMHDLVDVLMTTDGAENMAHTLSKYTEGSYSGIFDKQTNVVLDNQLVVFQVRDLEDSLRPIAMYIILNFLWNRIRSELKRRMMVIDEAWNLMQHEDSAKFLYGLIKRARKYYLGVTTITQDIEDFINSPYGKPIITNASLQILLKQSAAAVDNLQKLFYLTEGEKALLMNSSVGQGLFFANNKHVAIQIVASPQETEIISTKPEEVIARQKAAAAAAAAEKEADGAPTPAEETPEAAVKEQPQEEAPPAEVASAPEPDAKAEEAPTPAEPDTKAKDEPTEQAADAQEQEVAPEVNEGEKMPLSPEEEEQHTPRLNTIIAMQGTAPKEEPLPAEALAKEGVLAGAAKLEVGKPKATKKAEKESAKRAKLAATKKENLQRAARVKIDQNALLTQATPGDAVTEDAGSDAEGTPEEPTEEAA